MGTRDQELLAAAQPRAAVDAVHGQPPVQGAAAPAGGGQGHVLHGPRRPPDPRRHRRAVGGERRPLPPAHRRGDQEAGGEPGLRHRLPDAQPGRLPRGGSPGADHAQGHGPRVLRQLRVGGGGHRAQDRARLPPRARRGHPPRADRPRARLPRRGLRRHLRGRHDRQPQDVQRPAAARRRSPAAHPRPGAATPTRAASPSGARTSRTIWSGWSRCTTLPTSRRSSSSRWPAPPAC